MAKYDFDLFVIGGGSGGVRAGRVAASMGKRVGIAEEHRFGGTCVIRGCVPKKLFVYASEFPEHFEDAAGYGWTVGAGKFDWPSLDRGQGQGNRAAGGPVPQGPRQSSCQHFRHAGRAGGCPHDPALERQTKPSPPNIFSSPPAGAPIRTRRFWATNCASRPARRLI